MPKTSTPRRGRGRPTIALSKQLRPRGVRFTDAEWAWILDQAGERDLGVAEYCRQKLLRGMPR